MHIILKCFSTSLTETGFQCVHGCIVFMQSSALTGVLCRTDLMRDQITLLKLLYEQNEPLSQTELAERLRGGIHQNPERSLTGVLGAFGKRVNETHERLHQTYIHRGLSSSPDDMSHLENNDFVAVSRSRRFCCPVVNRSTGEIPSSLPLFSRTLFNPTTTLFGWIASHPA